MRYGWGVLVGVGLVLGAGHAFAETGTASIQGADGSPVKGTVVLTETPAGLHVSVTVEHVAPGKHGLHIHQFGACGDKGTAAGGHFNPDGVQHGFLPTDGLAKAHAGDFGNIEVGPEGTGSLDFTLPALTLSGGTYSVGGRAIVLHEKPDDFGQPTGNAGGRIGCGTIIITGQ